MSNLKKLGLSALAGSLALTSANAVDYAVTGDAILNFSSTKSDNTAANAPGTTGKGYGMDTDLYFNASGELDNGFTVSVFQAANTDSAWTNSSSQLTVGMGSMGTLQFNNIAGSKANGIDDVTPFAMDEAWGASPDRPDFFGASTASGSIDYRIPAQELSGVTVNASVTYDPSADVGAATARGVSSSSNGGIAYTLEMAANGISVGVGHETVEGHDNTVSGAAGGDEESVTGYVKYANGPITVGYQEAYQDTLNNGQDLSSVMMGIAYTSGDITVSYSEQSIQKEATSDTAAVESDLEALQVAYSMGAMTVSAAMQETSNANGTAGKTYEENEIQISFAF